MIIDKIWCVQYIKSHGTLGDVHRDAIGEESTWYPNHLAVFFGQGEIVSGHKMMKEY